MDTRLYHQSQQYIYLSWYEVVELLYKKGHIFILMGQESYKYAVYEKSAKFGLM